MKATGISHFVKTSPRLLLDLNSLLLTALAVTSFAMNVWFDCFGGQVFCRSGVTCEAGLLIFSASIEGSIARSGV